MADNPQQTVRELKDLVIAYAKQEATDPLKGICATSATASAGALLIGTGVFFLAIGLLRATRRATGAGWCTATGRGCRTSSTWSGLVIVAGLVWLARSRTQRRKTKRSKKP